MNSRMEAFREQVSGAATVLATEEVHEWEARRFILELTSARRQASVGSWTDSARVGG